MSDKEIVKTLAQVDYIRWKMNKPDALAVAVDQLLIAPLLEIEVATVVMEAREYLS